MENKEDEKWSVAIKVLVGNKKYREYRLPQSLSTDRSLLWRAKHEIGTRIADIIKSKKAEIAELKRRIKHIEQSQENWLLLAKSVNRRNEHFFLDALLASPDDIKKFEHTNFFSNNSWAKYRDLTELTREEIKDLYSSDSDEEQDVRCTHSLPIVEKLDHYKWICGQTNNLEENRFGNTDRGRNLQNNQVSANAVLESEERESSHSYNLNQPNFSMDGAGSSKTVEKNVDQRPLSVINNVTIEHFTVASTVNSASGNVDYISTEASNLENTVENDENNHGQSNASSLAFNGTPHNCCETDYSQRLVSEKTNVAGDAKKIEMHSTEINDTSCSKIDTSNKKLNCSQPNERPQLHTVNDLTNQEFAEEKLLKESNCISKPVSPLLSSEDTAGFSSLRLTSTRSSSLEPRTFAIIPKTSVNIWELRAAAREEKLIAERHLNQHQKPHYPISQATRNFNGSHVASRPEHQNHQSNSVMNTTEPTDSIGWIQFSAKKSRRQSNGSFSKDLEYKKVPSLINKLNSNENCTTKKPSEPEKQLIEPALSATLIMECEPFSSEAKSDQSKTEKRAKRRQRVQEKAKLSAKLNKEEERKANEKKRIEHDLRIESEKKERECRQRLEYEKKKQEIEEIRRERIKKETVRKGNGSDAIRIQEMLKSKDRLAKHIKEKELAYRMVGSKLFIEKRIPELAQDDELEINRRKYQTLKRYQNSIMNIENMNCFLVFISFRLVEPGNTFKLEDLLDYLSWRSSRPDGEPETAIHVHIQNTFDLFRKEKKLKIADCMVKALQFSNSVLAKIDKMPDQTEAVEKIRQILKKHKNLYDEMVDFIGITSYLRTRTDTEFFVMEEDYLLAVTQTENCGYQGEKIEFETDDDDKSEKHEVQDMSCQTDGEHYDVRAASLLPWME